MLTLQKRGLKYLRILITATKINYTINFELTFLYSNCGIISPPDWSSLDDSVTKPNRPSAFSWSCPLKGEGSTEIQSSAVVMGNTDFRSGTGAEASVGNNVGRISKGSDHVVPKDSAALDEEPSQCPIISLQGDCMKLCIIKFQKTHLATGIQSKLLILYRMTTLSRAIYIYIHAWGLNLTKNIW